ncbi:MAG: 16S rRNA (guanine(966)-N(2))-methyltransferase RsmD [Moraxellaceae bacterium]|jgi:16S rRNA (guanine966-N2)-methyltransferase|nr:16S rRNA (guanine(966)-N(2))-methyltransferase RsmD [Moraxellaceae bacterium]MBP9044766.1 16S rRNA (guanine(966)-N(2))-methyltransferase RsmD [Moraxellaceae bacterium]MBP9730295.1 16S rRNA (guanine(966)-N(2))-methyltransferase RsmD [Moraxellaceae bacterium]
MSRPGSSNTLRIVGGRWRSRRLRFIDADGLRPTPDRVRETLFNWLQFEIPGAHCLDAFAGSGALGFEALSRGAATAVMIERERLQHQALLAAAAELGADGARILLGYADSLLAKAGDWRPVAGFDVVFLDPPYNKGLVQKTVQQLLELGLLRTEALLYIESELDWEALSLPVSIQQLKSTRAGSVNAFLARYRPEVAE